MRAKYKVLEGLVSKDDCSRIAQIIRNTPGEGDSQVPMSRAHYGLPVCNTLLGLLCSRVSDGAKKTLRPAYSYCRVYNQGAELKPHKDRPSCEYSVTLNVSQTHAWPIFMGRRPLNLEPGDGCLYKGCEIEHSREKFEGDEYIQIFLHYVDVNGPYKDHIYDAEQKAEVATPHQYVFARKNPNLINYYRFLEVFSAEECQTLIDQKFSLRPGEIELGQISNTRRSQIYWIPKIQKWDGLHQKIMNLVAQCNQEFFNFSITSLTEHLQFTEYDASYQGYYDWHFDVGSGPINCARKLSVVVQLSDPEDYEGGELQFSLESDKTTTAEKSRGTVIIFPSYLRHRVTPVTKGTRRSLVTWITGPPFQ
jgi:PKHD-type hydroxylase